MWEEWGVVCVCVRECVSECVRVCVLMVFHICAFTDADPE